MSGTLPRWVERLLGEEPGLGEWKMGTGSEPKQMPNPRKSVAGSVPVPFFHGASISPLEKGDRHRRQRELPLPYGPSTEPVPLFELPHLRFEL